MKETLDPEIAQVLFIGNKIDKLGVTVNSKTYISGSCEKLKKFDEQLEKLKESEKETEHSQWIDWTYIAANDKKSVQKAIERLIKKYAI